MNAQRWLLGEESDAPDQAFRPARHDVAPLSEAAAKRFVTTHHYSGTYPAALHRFGLYRSGVLAGVAVISAPANTATLRRAFPGLTPFAQAAELGRFVLLDAVECNGESWFLGRIFAALSGQGLCGMVSFSDPVPRRTAAGRVVMPGHVGVIYQATNATYTGRSKPGWLWLLPDGTVLPPRSLAKLRNGEVGERYVMRVLESYGAPARHVGEAAATWLLRSLAAIGARRLRHPGNHRYLFRLGPPAIRRRVRLGLAAQPYPKGVDA